MEDIKSLIPEKLNVTIEEMEKDAILLLKEYKEFEERFWLDNKNVSIGKINYRE